ncbi:hypothetical protein K461DRAFT_315878, partial [Myriangium duriaei CBS 260.36]
MKSLAFIYSVLVALFTCSAYAVSEECKELQPYLRLTNNHITHPVYFCKYYLLSPRTRSPLLHVDATTLTSACKCILTQHGVDIPTPKISPAVSSPVSRPAPQCNTKYRKLIRKSFYEPRAFCAYYHASARFHSPVPGATVQNIIDGCACIKALSTTTEVPVETLTVIPTESTDVARSDTFTNTPETSTAVDTPVNTFTDSGPLPLTTEIAHVVNAGNSQTYDMTLSMLTSGNGSYMNGGQVYNGASFTATLATTEAFASCVSYAGAYQSAGIPLMVNFFLQTNNNWQCILVRTDEGDELSWAAADAVECSWAFKEEG